MQSTIARVARSGLVGWLLGTGAVLKMQRRSERVMYKHILIPTDGSDLSLKAVQHGILLARAVGAKVTSIAVVSPVLLFDLEPDKFAEPSEEWGYKPQLESFASKCLDQVKTVALANDVT